MDLASEKSSEGFGPLSSADRTHPAISRFPGAGIRVWGERGLVCLVAFIGHFIFLSDFGLYEDDLIYVLPTLPWRFSNWIQYLVNTVPMCPQGRPIYYALQPTLTFLLFKLGGLELCHLFSGFVVAINGVLALLLLQRLISREAALVGALVLVLFPIDTSRQLIMHQGALLLPMTMLLGSLHLYVRGRRVAATVLASLLLLTYESFYLPFLVAPFLCKEKGAQLLKRCAIHGLVFFSVAGGVLLGRNFLGEQRARDVLQNGGDTVSKIIRACLEGPWMGAKFLIARPIDAWRHSSPLGMLIALVVFSLTLLALRRLCARTLRPSPAPISDSPSYLGLLAGAGIIAWSVSYLLSFRPDYFPPIVSIGRLSGVHSVASLGAAITVGCCFQALFNLSFRPIRIAAIVIASFMVAGMTAFAVQIQRSEYVNYWDQQKRFLIALIGSIPDVRERDVVILEFSADPRVIPATEGFGLYDQIVYGPLVLPYFVKFPDTWKLKPRVYTYWPQGTKAEETATGLRLELPTWEPSIWPTLTQNNLIYLKVEASKIVRVAGEVEICGRKFEARPNPIVLPKPLVWSEIFKKLVNPDETKHWMTIREAVNYPR